jgi:hypothetical protein
MNLKCLTCKGSHNPEAVPQFELVICDLFLGIWIFSAVTGIDNYRAVVLVILVAAGNDDGIGALILGT